MIRTVLIDDEAPARDRLRSLLDACEEVEIVGEAGDGEQALRVVAERRPDLIFLDIEMPGRNGMEVAATLTPPRPRIVFCTAFDQYAIEAFEHHALDYLLKPVNRERLQSTIERVRATLAESRESRRELDAASRTQERLYPQVPTPITGLDYAGCCRSARGVGGDYYDFLPAGERRLGIAVGDVSGKGIFAGLLMAGLQARLQSLAARHETALPLLFESINRSTYESTDANRYATLFYGVYDGADGRMRYVNAGHNAPLLLRPDGTTVRLESNGPAVGMLPDARYEEASVALEPGCMLLGYTDGVTEALDPAGQEFGEARLERWARALINLEAAAACEALVGHVESFAAGPGPADDLTLSLVRVEARR